MASVTGMLVIPTNSWRFGDGLEVSGKAGAALSAGDVVVSTDGENWTQAGASETGYVGVVMEDPTKGASFASGDSITVRISGGVVVNTTAAAVNEGDTLGTGAAGTVAALTLAAIGDVTKIIGTAVTAVDASGGKLIAILGKV